MQSHERIACCDVYRAGDGVHAEWLAQRSRVQSPLGWLATAASPHHRYLLAAERELFGSPRLKAVICNSEMVRGEIRRRFATPADKLVLIRNAVDGRAFHPGLREEFGAAVRQQVGIPPDATVFVLRGLGLREEGRGALPARPRAAARARLGDRRRQGQALGRLRPPRVRLGVAERVRFVGAVSDVRPFLAAADAFVLPTLYDPFPNAALEAMAAGCRW